MNASGSISTRPMQWVCSSLNRQDGPLARTGAWSFASRITCSGPTGARATRRSISSTLPTTRTSPGRDMSGKPRRAGHGSNAILKATRRSGRSSSCPPARRECGHPVDQHGGGADHGLQPRIHWLSHTPGHVCRLRTRRWRAVACPLPLYGSQRPGRCSPRQTIPALCRGLQRQRSARLLCHQDERICRCVRQCASRNAGSNRCAAQRTACWRPQRLAAADLRGAA